MEMKPASLVLSTGEVFHGQAPLWQDDCYFGEVVFNTGMVGYVESLTDPSYAGQILTFTYPLVGNYGVPAADTWESSKIHARGVVVSEAAPHHSHHAARQDFLSWLASQNVPIICEVDTRALTKALRDHGTVTGAIVCNGRKPGKYPNLEAINWVSEVSIKAPEVYGKGKKKIIAVDCGMKTNILRCLQNSKMQIKRVPYDYDYTGEAYDGVFISNGPGDPITCKDTVAILREAMQRQKPVFGICLGTQLMALAVQAKTYKLRFGHRGQNHPCLHIPSGRCYLTSQNHGYAIDEKTLPKDWQVTFRHLNDDTVSGIAHKRHPFFSVQFHPEAAPGPVDTQWLFDEFYKAL